MKTSPADQTTAKNLEEKFDRGEEVLDYFEVTRARVINPQSKGSVVQTKFAHPASRIPIDARRFAENQGVIRKK